MIKIVKRMQMILKNLTMQMVKKLQFLICVSVFICIIFIVKSLFVLYVLEKKMFLFLKSFIVIIFILLFNCFSRLLFNKTCLI